MLIDNMIMNYIMLRNNRALSIRRMIDRKGIIKNNGVDINISNREIRKTNFVLLHKGWERVQLGGDDEPHYCPF